MGQTVSARSVVDGASYEGFSAEALLAEMIRVFAGRIALVSSFGTDSAVLLHMLAVIDPSTPVLFVDTGKLFPETLTYRDALTAHLGLRDVRGVAPSAARVARADPGGTLWRDDPDTCCWQRKVEPLDEALAPFDAWISGRKQYQALSRAALPLIEHEAGRTKINPLARWRPTDIATYRAAHDLPAHPLEAMGFRSIGCAPCTRATRPGEDARAGRWAGIDKTECGIHTARPAAAGTRS